MLASLVLPAFNRVLRSNDWALQRLRGHAGKRARIAAPPLAVTIEVEPGGELAAARDADGPDVAVTVGPGALVRLLARDPAVWSEVAVTGDSDFATALHQVWQQLDWGIEEDLSHVFGDIAAHRMAGGARAVRDTVGHALGSALRNVVEYWTEERPVVVVRRDVESYCRQVDALRDDVERLAKRIEALQAGGPPRFGAEYPHNNISPPTGAGA